MLDSERTDEFIKYILDRYTATELVELLDLTTEQIVGAFFEETLNIELDKVE